MTTFDQYEKILLIVETYSLNSNLYINQTSENFIKNEIFVLFDLIAQN